MSSEPAANRPATWHCPKCSAPADAAGEAVVGDDVLTIYQCETCTVTKDFFGDGGSVTFAVTWAVNAAGQIVAEPGAGA